MENKKLLSWAGVIIVIALAVIIAITLFGISATKISLTKKASTQKAQVYSSKIDLIERVRFEQYSAPAYVIVY